MKRHCDIYFLLAFVVGILSLTLFAPSCANTTQAPTGGLKDTLPPVLVHINPLPGSVNVPQSKTELVFTFDEYVTIKTATNIFLSPPQEKAPKSKLRGKSVVVSFEEDLLPNTTYTLEMSDAIADNNEGNMFPGYTYVFSTGPEIDSMYITGVVQDCRNLDPVKGAKVLLYKDFADSAVFLRRPVAAARTDDWGFFAIPHIQDTVYRIYAVKDANNNNIYDPDSEQIGFLDTLVVPVGKVNDSIPELKKYDMKDTLACLARKAAVELNIFREKPSKQYVVNRVRTAERAAYVTFMAPNAWIDSVWVRGIPASKLITQFNIEQDSLEIWVNDRRKNLDTLHLFINYRKTDSTGLLKPDVEHFKLVMEGGKKTLSKMSRRDIKHDDTTCILKLKAEPETVEQNGLEMEFNFPIIYEKFDSIRFTYLNPKQKEFKGEFSVQRDTLNLRKYRLTPKVKLQKGFEYRFKVPARAFRDINGFWSDSTEVKFSLPTDETLSTLILNVSGVREKYIIDLLNEKRDKVLRSYIIGSDSQLNFPYLKQGRYCIRITEDKNRNSIVDTGSLLEQRQPEKVRFLLVDSDKYIDVPASVEMTQSVDLQELFTK